MTTTLTTGQVSELRGFCRTASIDGFRYVYTLVRRVSPRDTRDQTIAIMHSEWLSRRIVGPKGKLP